MSTYKEVLDAKPFPWFIKESEFMRAHYHNQVRKIFPEIGLSNSYEDIEIDHSGEAAKSGRLFLRSVYRSVICYAQAVSKSHDLYQILRSFAAQVYRTSKCIQCKNGRITFNLYADINEKNGKPLFKAGESIIRIYNKLITITISYLHMYGAYLPKLEDLREFKEFNKANMPKTKYRIHFSSDGIDGLWDIATMSMRGIISCQSWNGSRMGCLVGSMLDPFTGIIYLSSNKNYENKGATMLRRCVVRFVLNSKTQKPTIGIEKMYPSHSKKVHDAFVAFIKKRVGKKYQVRSLYADNRNNCFIPQSQILNGFDSCSLPYRDSGVGFMHPDVVLQQAIMKKAIGGKLKKCKKVITPAISTQLRGKKTTEKRCFQPFISPRASSKRVLESTIVHRINSLIDSSLRTNKDSKSAILSASRIPIRYIDRLLFMYCDRQKRRPDRKLTREIAWAIKRALVAELKLLASKPLKQRKPKPKPEPIYAKYLN